MNILALHLGHDGSITVISGDEIIVHHQLDRFNKYKHEYIPSHNILIKLKELNIKFNKVIITSMGSTLFPINYFLHKFFNVESKDIYEVNQTEHHYFHALCARHFFNNPKNAIYYISDGEGAVQPLQHESKYINGVNVCENESIYDEHLSHLFRNLGTWSMLNVETDKVRIHPTISLGKAYQQLTYELGLEEFEEGKTMAFSSYGKFNQNIFNSIIYRDKWNECLFKRHAEPYDSTNKYNRFMLPPNVNHFKRNSKSADFVHTFQKAFEHLFELTLDKIKHNYDTIVLSGGCAQNILNNTKLKVNRQINVLADPFNGDFGISLGAALHVAAQNQIDVKPLKHICSGFDVENDWSKFAHKKTNALEVAKILLKEPIAIFSGKSEQGQRGLGFRSLLANPLLENCNELVNKIKKREWYRPFACTILHEEAHRYFEIEKGEESPYMMFVYKSKNPKLTNVCSVDGWSRIQTLKKDFHPKFYQLIKAFQKISFIPAVLNTSLNLPGEVLCEDSNDLYKLMKTSKLKYAYICDEDKLVWLE